MVRYKERIELLNIESPHNILLKVFLYKEQYKKEL